MSHLITDKWTVSCWWRNKLNSNHIVSKTNSSSGLSASEKKEIFQNWVLLIDLILSFLMVNCESQALFEAWKKVSNSSWKLFRNEMKQVEVFTLIITIQIGRLGDCIAITHSSPTEQLTGQPTRQTLPRVLYPLTFPSLRSVPFRFFAFIFFFSVSEFFNFSTGVLGGIFYFLVRHSWRITELKISSDTMCHVLACWWHTQL